jgi:hypothetical protein
VDQVLKDVVDLTDSSKEKAKTHVNPRQKAAGRDETGKQKVPAEIFNRQQRLDANK